MSGTGKFCISLTRTDDPDRATMAFQVARAALSADQETLVFLSTEAVGLAVGLSTEKAVDDGSQRLGELIDEFVEAGGQILVNASCVKRRRLNDDQLVKGASMGDPAKLVEFLSDGTPCISY